MACASTSNNPITIIDLKKKTLFLHKVFPKYMENYPCFPSPRHLHLKYYLQVQLNKVTA